MNIYLLKPTRDTSYEDYLGAVVAAEDEDSARLIHPDGMSVYGEHNWELDWQNPEALSVTLIGTTDRPSGLILGSFNAG